MASERPITLRSSKAGLALVAKRGETYTPPGGGAERMRYGKWIEFRRGQAVIQPAQYKAIWGSRDEAVKALKARRSYGSDFVIVDLPAEPGPGPSAATPPPKA